ncbi:hypothetical protein HispidOSU_021060, partial [Sigmodon hispidus]
FFLKRCSLVLSPWSIKTIAEPPSTSRTSSESWAEGISCYPIILGHEKKKKTHKNN